MIETTIARDLLLLTRIDKPALLRRLFELSCRYSGQVLNTALMTATSGRTPQDALGDPEFRGRLIESDVGAHLVNGARHAGFEVHYWRDGAREVDFVLSKGEALTAIEVKSARTPADAWLS